MTIINMFPMLERTLPLMLFALYLLTAVRICRYSSWIAAGQPNPFLPRRLAIAVAHANIRTRRFT